MLGGLDLVLDRIRRMEGARILVALAGPPGSGKSTFAAALVAALAAPDADAAALVPMDGFHFDDAVLRQQGTLARKGAPFTFDVGGLGSLLRRLRDNDEPEIAIPVFDRALEIARAGARLVPATSRVVVVEGNYLLLDDPAWTKLRGAFDLTVMLREERAIVEARLTTRWLSFGFSPEQARAKVERNDLPNVDLVLARSGPADITLEGARLPG